MAKLSTKKRLDNLYQAQLLSWISIVLWLLNLFYNGMELKFWTYPLWSMVLTIIAEIMFLIALYKGFKK